MRRWELPVSDKWFVASGSVKHGRPEIIAYLRGLFADANFNVGTLKAPPQSSIRVLTNDVVIIVSAHLLIEGRKLLDGGVIDERDNHSLRVLQRESDGTWPVVSEMYMRQSRPVIRRSLMTQSRSRK